jgi:hypothetical protein
VAKKSRVEESDDPSGIGAVWSASEAPRVVSKFEEVVNEIPLLAKQVVDAFYQLKVIVRRDDPFSTAKDDPIWVTLETSRQSLLLLEREIAAFAQNPDRLAPPYMPMAAARIQPVHARVPVKTKPPRRRG